MGKKLIYEITEYIEREINNMVEGASQIPLSVLYQIAQVILTHISGSGTRSRIEDLSLLTSGTDKLREIPVKKVTSESNASLSLSHSNLRISTGLRVLGFEPWSILLDFVSVAQLRGNSLHLENGDEYILHTHEEVTLHNNYYVKLQPPSLRSTSAHGI